MQTLNIQLSTTTELAADTTDIMAPLTVLFKPSYTALKNLYYKIYKYTTITSVNLFLPIRLQDLFIDLTLYINSTIGILNNLTVYLYNNNTLQAIRVIEVKSKVLTTMDRVNTKVNKVKTDIVELKIDITELKTDIIELKTDIIELKIDIIELKIDITELKIDIIEIKIEIKLLKEY